MNLQCRTEAPLHVLHLQTKQQQQKFIINRLQLGDCFFNEFNMLSNVGELPLEHVIDDVGWPLEECWNRAATV